MGPRGPPPRGPPCGPLFRGPRYSPDVPGQAFGKRKKRLLKRKKVSAALKKMCKKTKCV